MKTSSLLVLMSAGFLTWPAHGAENFDLSKRWRARIDLGGTFPEAAALTELGGPVTSGNQMKLSPGMQVDVAVGYRLTPWLTLE